MSTLSGVFPNAITPTIAPSQDPAGQSRLRRENEAAVFAPVDEVAATVSSRATGISQPGRLASEQALASATALADRPTADISAARTSERPDQASQRAGNSQAAEVGKQVGNQVDKQVDNQVGNQVDKQVGKQAGNQVDNPVSNRDRDQVARQEQSAQQADRQAQKERIQLEDDLDLVRDLASRDREVRAHEQAHQSVGGQHAGAMAFTFQSGPDGKRYAVGGEVPIDMGRVAGNPEANLQKGEQVRRAALAPAEPSNQDRQVAVAASQMVLEAQTEIRQVEREQIDKAAEQRGEQGEMQKEDVAKTEASSAKVDESAERAASEGEQRLEDIFKQTSRAVESTLVAAYRTQQQQEVGFNLDTTV
ncbi:putative metalloprotease CJM1_0395 family protein [Reinekea sp.]|jgi:hypothetical protein|uniref:putative metalloprotease CJM1_0395 family protein n=1 Tax=Reinekea sp. TaxID=1970455 RepID=UPI002A82AC19|nr:putative metalloprotease CJM1_0395 family protein [Reinekea sp.]